MNRPQQIVIFCGLILIVVLCLRPPYQWRHTAYLINRQTGVPHQVETNMQNIGHCWIWRPPAGWNDAPYSTVRLSHIALVDWSRLGVYVGLTTAITLFGAFVMFRSKTP